MPPVPPPEIVEILNQVQDELQALVAAGVTGTVTIHCGVRDIMVQVDCKRKRKPVLLKPKDAPAPTRKALSGQ